MHICMMRGLLEDASKDKGILVSGSLDMCNSNVILNTYKVQSTVSAASTNNSTALVTLMEALVG